MSGFPLKASRRPRRTNRRLIILQWMLSGYSKGKIGAELQGGNPQRGATIPSCVSKLVALNYICKLRPEGLVTALPFSR